MIQAASFHRLNDNLLLNAQIHLVSKRRQLLVTSQTHHIVGWAGFDSFTADDDISNAVREEHVFDTIRDAEEDASMELVNRMELTGVKARPREPRAYEARFIDHSSGMLFHQGDLKPKDTLFYNSKAMREHFNEALHRQEPFSFAMDLKDEAGKFNPQLVGLIPLKKLTAYIYATQQSAHPGQNVTRVEINAYPAQAICDLDATGWSTVPSALTAAPQR